MRLRFFRAALLAGAALSTPLLAQRGAQDWTTAGYDAQRSNWLRGDGKITPESVGKHAIELLWKVKLNNAPRQTSALTPPALLDFYIGYRGFRTLGFFGGSSDVVVGIDTDLARIEWEKKIGTPGAAGTVQCPGGTTSAVARITPLNFPASGFGRGRGNPGKSGVGEPGEGAVTLKDVRPPQAAPPPPPPAAATKTGRRQPQASAASPYTPRAQYAYAVSGDGKLHLLYVSNGEEPNPAIDFVPANSNAVGLMVFEGMAYVATVNNCGGTPDGIWAVDLESKKVLQWKANGKIAGTQGFAVAPDGTLFVAAGNELVALDSETLQSKGSYKAGAAFTSSPLVLEWKGKSAVAATTADGRLHVVDSGMAPLGSGDAGVGSYAVGALASYQETGSTRWILAPSATKIVALKMTDKGGAVAVEPGWTSRDMVSPITPAVVNGVIFAVSAGKRGTPAVLYGLDAAGKEVWSSGKSIASFVTTGGLAAGGGRIYVSTHDGTQYAFGAPMEH